MGIDWADALVNATVPVEGITVPIAFEPANCIVPPSVRVPDPVNTAARSGSVPAEAVAPLKTRLPEADAVPEEMESWIDRFVSETVDGAIKKTIFPPALSVPGPTLKIDFPAPFGAFRKTSPPTFKELEPSARVRKEAVLSELVPRETEAQEAE